ncbi:hypothetical protein BDR07DRAFT_1460922 [Suillus spraguei]|nr:hypothetical protein BDR07DRAFT_1460922 [Suillus spraguei]
MSTELPRTGCGWKGVLEGRAFDFAELQHVDEGLVPAVIEDENVVTDHDANEDGLEHLSFVAAGRVPVSSNDEVVNEVVMRDQDSSECSVVAKIIVNAATVMTQRL